AMVTEGFKIHERQREMKEELSSLEDLHSIRKLLVNSEKI
ncbi:DUF4376 domain-containing protein, partial [Escherichia coli]